MNPFEQWMRENYTNDGATPLGNFTRDLPTCPPRATRDELLVLTCKDSWDRSVFDHGWKHYIVDVLSEVL